MRRALIRTAIISYMVAEFFLTPELGLVRAHAQAGPISTPGGATITQGNAFTWSSTPHTIAETITDQFNRLRAAISNNGSLWVTIHPSLDVHANGGGYTLGATSALLVPNMPGGRRLINVKNESTTATIAVCFGACTAVLNTAGNYTLGPGQGILWNTSQAVPTDEIHGIASAATTPVTVEVH